MLELLAPAGSMEALRAAVQNGANAVYLGCGSFNARQSAKNFTPQALTEAVKYCHIRGVAVHLTLNTLVSDKEMDDALDLIRHAASAGVDAFIVQDLGMIQLCRQVAPEVPIHGSTQMTVHSLPGVQLCAAWGLSRVVLSRELNRDEIAHICRNSPIEIEVFAHGALCMCYSGQCYMSAAIGGRSGNRGRCAQPCRQTYGYGRWEDRYPLSLKDNCLVYNLQELEAMGVVSLKLEGRMKRPEYVAAVTSVYRAAIDKRHVSPEMMQLLHAAFNRQGFTDGYYANRIGPDMFGRREDKPENDAWAKQMRQTYENTENSLVPITLQFLMTQEESRITAMDPDGRVCTLQGPAPEPARTTELTEEAVSNRLFKTGGTPYLCTQVQCRVAPGMTLSAAAINAMRRDVLNLLTAQRARRDVPVLQKPLPVSHHKGSKQKPQLTVQITSLDQITEKLLNMDLSVLYVPLHFLVEDPELCQMLTQRLRVCAVAPRILHDGQMDRFQRDLRTVKALGVRQVLVGNIGHIIPARQCGMGVRGDFGLNIYNSRSVDAAAELELKSVCLSFEMTMPQIRDLSKSVPCELLTYGRMPLMVTENCLIRGKTGQCSCHIGPAKLKDKIGAEFPIIRDGDSCRSVLLNGKKLYWLDKASALGKLGLWATRLFFTTENAMEVDQVLTAYEVGGAFDPGACTRGLYYRGLE